MVLPTKGWQVRPARQAADILSSLRRRDWLLLGPPPSCEAACSTGHFGNKGHKGVWLKGIQTRQT